MCVLCVTMRERMGVIVHESVRMSRCVSDASEKGQGGQTGTRLSGKSAALVAVKFHRCLPKRNDVSAGVHRHVAPLLSILSGSCIQFHNHIVGSDSDLTRSEAGPRGFLGTVSPLPSSSFSFSFWFGWRTP